MGSALEAFSHSKYHSTTERWIDYNIRSMADKPYSHNTYPEILKKWVALGKVAKGLVNANDTSKKKSARRIPKRSEYVDLLQATQYLTKHFDDAIAADVQECATRLDEADKWLADMHDVISSVNPFEGKADFEDVEKTLHDAPEHVDLPEVHALEFIKDSILAWERNAEFLLKGSSQEGGDVYLYHLEEAIREGKSLVCKPSDALLYKLQVQFEEAQRLVNKIHRSCPRNVASWKLGGVDILPLRKLLRLLEDVEETRLVIPESAALRSIIQDAQAFQQAYLHIDKTDAAQMNKLIKTLNTLPCDFEKERSELQTMVTSVKGWMEKIQSVLKGKSKSKMPYEDLVETAKMMQSIPISPQDKEAVLMSLATAEVWKKEVDAMDLDELGMEDEAQVGELLKRANALRVLMPSASKLDFVTKCFAWNKAANALLNLDVGEAKLSQYKTLVKSGLSMKRQADEQDMCIPVVEQVLVTLQAHQYGAEEFITRLNVVLGKTKQSKRATPAEAEEVVEMYLSGNVMVNFVDLIEQVQRELAKVFRFQEKLAEFLPKEEMSPRVAEQPMELMDAAFYERIQVTPSSTNNNKLRGIGEIDIWLKAIERMKVDMPERAYLKQARAQASEWVHNWELLFNETTSRKSKRAKVAVSANENASAESMLQTAAQLIQDARALIIHDDDKVEACEKLISGVKDDLNSVSALVKAYVGLIKPVDPNQPVLESITPNSKDKPLMERLGVDLKRNGVLMKDKDLGYLADQMEAFKAVQADFVDGHMSEDMHVLLRNTKTLNAHLMETGNDLVNSSLDARICFLIENAATWISATQGLGVDISMTYPQLMEVIMDGTRLLNYPKCPSKLTPAAAVVPSDTKRRRRTNKKSKTLDADLVVMDKKVKKEHRMELSDLLGSPTDRKKMPTARSRKSTFYDKYKEIEWRPVQGICLVGTLEGNSSRENSLGHVIRTRLKFLCQLVSITMLWETGVRILQEERRANRSFYALDMLFREVQALKCVSEAKEQIVEWYDEYTNWTRTATDKMNSGKAGMFGLFDCF